jgi:hypothetical protein
MRQATRHVPPTNAGDLNPPVPLGIPSFSPTPRHDGAPSAHGRDNKERARRVAEIAGSASVQLQCQPGCRSDRILLRSPPTFPGETTARTE